MNKELTIEQQRIIPLVKSLSDTYDNLTYSIKEKSIQVQTDNDTYTLSYFESYGWQAFIQLENKDIFHETEKEHILYKKLQLVADQYNAFFRIDNQPESSIFNHE